MSRLQDHILRDTRVNQPAASAVAVGSIYYVTDELVTERSNGSTWDDISDAGGSGDVVGPASATDKALVRFDGAGGKLIQDSLITLSDAGAFTLPDGVTQVFNPDGTLAGINVGAHTADPSAPVNGDMWYNSTTEKLKAQINGVSVVLGAGGIPSDVIITPDTVANLPAAATAGRVFLPTNGYYLYRDNGASWDTWYNGRQVTEPVDGDFAWINQGGASVSTTNGGIYLSSPASASTNLRIRKKAAPSTPYTITAQVIPSYSVSHADMGVLFRQSSDGKLHTFRFSAATGIAATAVRSRKLTNATTTNSDYNLVTGAADIPIFISTPFWMRIADDGANRILSYSVDGYNFVTVLTIGRTDFLTADEVGFFANSVNASLACGITLLSWEEA